MTVETILKTQTVGKAEEWAEDRFPTALREVLNQLPSRRRRRRLVRTVLLLAVLAVVGGIVAVLVKVPAWQPAPSDDTDPAESTDGEA
jgi:hypothetical protein